MFRCKKSFMSWSKLSRLDAHLSPMTRPRVPTNVASRPVTRGEERNLFIIIPKIKMCGEKIFSRKLEEKTSMKRQKANAQINKFI